MNVLSEWNLFMCEDLYILYIYIYFFKAYQVMNQRKEVLYKNIGEITKVNILDACIVTNFCN